VTRIKEFKGECVGIRLTQRAENDLHICFTTLVEDDENWYEKDGGSFSSHWLNENISVLQEAKDWLEKNADPEMCEITAGKVLQFGWKFRP
jgi:hypothetical protein